MIKKDIEILKGVLRARGYLDLADLLQYSYCKVDIDYDNLGPSCKLKIFAPIEIYERLRQLAPEQNMLLLRISEEVFHLDEYHCTTIGIDYVIDTTSEGWRETILKSDVLSMENYEYILGVIRSTGKGLERSPETFAEMGEEQLRDIFLVTLNGYL